MSKLLYIVPCRSAKDVSPAYHELNNALQKVPKVTEAGVVLILPPLVTADIFLNLPQNPKIKLVPYDDLESLSGTLGEDQQTLQHFKHKLQKHGIKNNTGFVLSGLLKINAYLNNQEKSKKQRVPAESTCSFAEQQLQDILAQYKETIYYIIAPAGLSSEATTAFLRNISKKSILVSLPTSKELLVDYNSILTEQQTLQAASEDLQNADTTSTESQPMIKIPLESGCCLIPDSAVALKLSKRHPELSRFIAALDLSLVSLTNLSEEVFKNPNYHLEHFLAYLLEENKIVKHEKAYRVLSSAKLAFPQSSEDIADDTKKRLKLHEQLLKTNGSLAMLSSKNNKDIDPNLPPWTVQISITKDPSVGIALYYTHKDRNTKKPLSLNNERLLLSESGIKESAGGLKDNKSTKSAASTPPVRKEDRAVLNKPHLGHHGMSTMNLSRDRSDQPRKQSQSCLTISQQPKKPTPSKLLEPLEALEAPKAGHSSSIASPEGTKFDDINKQNKVTFQEAEVAGSKNFFGNQAAKDPDKLTVNKPVKLKSHQSSLSRITEPSSARQSPSSSPEESAKLFDIRSSPDTKIDNAKSKSKTDEQHQHLKKKMENIFCIEI